MGRCYSHYGVRLDPLCAWDIMDPSSRLVSLDTTINRMVREQSSGNTSSSDIELGALQQALEPRT